MLIFIQNEPRAYAWGSTNALPEVLEQPQTGEPQAELWLGDHRAGPAKVGGELTVPMTLIDLIAENPEAYGVDGGQLPFLLKLLGIGAPLSLQVHPRIDQAREGFAREEEAGIALDDPRRSYKDANHKPELLVALSEVRALSGFRELIDVHADVAALAVAAGSCGAEGSQALFAFSEMTAQAARQREEVARDSLLDWVFAASPNVHAVVEALTAVVQAQSVFGVDRVRIEAMRNIAREHPGDPGLIISLLLNLVALDPGEAIFLDAGQLHAYLSGVGVEIMASSDNVLRAGLTEKHIDVDEFRRIIDLTTNEHPVFPGRRVAAGLTTWQPPVPDFVLHRVRVDDPEHSDARVRHDAGATVRIYAEYPVIMITTEGMIRVERQGSDLFEVATVRKGHSLYISAGGFIEFSGIGEAFVASVGAGWGSDISADHGVS